MTRDEIEAEFYDWECRQILGVQSQDVDLIVSLAREFGGPVLELGCGSGRITVPLASSGIEVVAVDRNPWMLSNLRRKFESTVADVGARVQVVETDICDFDLDAQFPFIIAPYNVLCYLLDPAQLRLCLRAVHRHLKPGGHFFCQVEPVQTTVRRRSTWELLAVDFLQAQGGPVVALYERTRSDHSREIISFDERYVVFCPDGTKQTHEYTLRMRSVHRSEIELLFELEGYRVIRAFAGLDLSSIEIDSAATFIYISQRMDPKN
jgi:2-polyprenyl-3-methyl-5-hydroxy-6-metoxy-1,4-benzoquinol methylase